MEGLHTAAGAHKDLDQLSEVSATDLDHVLQRALLRAASRNRRPVLGRRECPSHSSSKNDVEADLVEWKENQAFLPAHLADPHDRVQDRADIGVLQPPVVRHLGHKQLQHVDVGLDSPVSIRSGLGQVVWIGERRAGRTRRTYVLLLVQLEQHLLERKVFLGCCFNAGGRAATRTYDMVRTGSEVGDKAMGSTGHELVNPAQTPSEL